MADLNEILGLDTGNPYEDWVEKSRLLDEFISDAGIEGPQANTIKTKLIGEEPIQEAGFLTRAGRAVDLGQEEFFRNVGAIGQYAGGLTGIEGLEQSGKELYDEQAQAMSEMALPYETDPEKQGFLDYSLMGIQSTIGTAPIAVAPGIIAATLPATGAAGLAAGFGASALTNMALEGGNTYAEGKARGLSDQEALEYANEVATQQVADPRMAALNVIQSVTPARFMPNAGFLARAGTGIAQQSVTGGAEEMVQYDISKEVETGQPYDVWSDPQARSEGIVGAISSGAMGIISAPVDPRVDEEKSKLQKNLVSQTMEGLDEDATQQARNTKDDLDILSKRLKNEKDYLDLVEKKYNVEKTIADLEAEMETARELEGQERVVAMERIKEGVDVVKNALKQEEGPFTLEEINTAGGQNIGKNKQGRDIYEVDGRRFIMGSDQQLYPESQMEGAEQSNEFQTAEEVDITRQEAKDQRDADRQAEREEKQAEREATKAERDRIKQEEADRKQAERDTEAETKRKADEDALKQRQEDAQKARDTMQMFQEEYDASTDVEARESLSENLQAEELELRNILKDINRMEDKATGKRPGGQKQMKRLKELSELQNRKKQRDAAEKKRLAEIRKQQQAETKAEKQATAEAEKKTKLEEKAKTAAEKAEQKKLDQIEKDRAKVEKFDERVNAKLDALENTKGEKTKTTLNRQIGVIENERNKLAKSLKDRGEDIQDFQRTTPEPTEDATITPIEEVTEEQTQEGIEDTVEASPESVVTPEEEVVVQDAVQEDVQEDVQDVQQDVQEDVQETKEAPKSWDDENFRIPVRKLITRDPDRAESLEYDYEDGMNFDDYVEDRMDKKQDQLDDAGSNRDADDFYNDIVNKATAKFEKEFNKLQKQKPVTEDVTTDAAPEVETKAEPEAEPTPEITPEPTPEDNFKKDYKIPGELDFSGLDYNDSKAVIARFNENIPKLEGQQKKDLIESRRQYRLDIEDGATFETTAEIDRDVEMGTDDDVSAQSIINEQGTATLEDAAIEGGVFDQDDVASSQLEDERASLSSRTRPEDAPQANLTSRQNKVVLGSFRKLLPKLQQKVEIGENKQDSIQIFETQNQAIEFLKQNFGPKTAEKFLASEERVEGIHVGGVTVLISENMAGATVKDTVDRMAEVMFHEEIGHRGLKGFFGERFQEFLDRFDSGMNKARINKWLASQKDEQGNLAGYNQPGISRREQVEEYIVSVHAEKGSRKTTLVEELVYAIRKMFGSGQYSDTAVKKAIQAIEKDYARDDSSSLMDGLQFQIREEQGTDDDVFMRMSKSKKPNLKRDPDVVQAAKDYEAGTKTQDEYIKVVREKMPIVPMEKQDVEFPTIPEINEALKEPQLAKGIYNVGDQVINKIKETGNRVAARLDIPAYTRAGRWIVSLHEGAEKLGKVVGYSQTAHLKTSPDGRKVEFVTDPKTALKIAKGDKDKSTFARMFGEFTEHDPKALHKEALKLMDSKEWIQVGMNPFRHSYFYDKADGNPVVEADEVIQVGALVLAKNATKTTPDDAQFQVGDTDLRFSKAPPVKSTAFKNWFGESKVVNEKGEPLVVYHGGFTDIKEFKAKESGIYFTSSPIVADSYSMPIPKAQTTPAFISLQNPKIVDFKNREWFGINKEVKKAKEQGHDGLIAKNIIDPGNFRGGGKDLFKSANTYVAFKPTQIKSIYNRGTFDPNNPDIRFKKTIARKEYEKHGLTSYKTMKEVLGPYPEYLDDVVKSLETMRQRVLNGQIKNRDIVKAWVMTAGSQNASPRSYEKYKNKFTFDLDPRFADTYNGKLMVRPEGMVAGWLGSPAGQRALNEADKGNFDYSLYKDLEVNRNVVYGLAKKISDIFLAKEKKGMDSIPEMVKIINEGRNEEAINKALSDVKGIGTIKDPFFKHFFGFSSFPTMDVNELNFWIYGPEGKTEAKFPFRKNVTVDEKLMLEIRDIVKTRFEKLREEGITPTSIPEDSYQEIIHHWLFDAVQGIKTEHKGVYEAQLNFAKSIPSRKHGEIVVDPLFVDLSRITGISDRDLERILAGNGPFVFTWDRMRGDGYYETPSGIRIALQGGPANSYITYNLAAGIIGSSKMDMKSAIENRVRDSNGIGLVALLTPDAHKSNPTFFKIYTQVLRDLIASKQISGPDLYQAFYDIVHGPTDPAKAKNKKMAGLANLFQKGGNSREAKALKAMFDAKTPAKAFDVFEKLGFSELKFDTRGMLVAELGSDSRSREMGFPSYLQIARDTIDPALADMPSGAIVQAMEFDKKTPVTTAAARGLTINQEHISYDAAFIGTPIGRFSEAVPIEVVVGKYMERLNKSRSVFVRSTQVRMPFDLDLTKEDLKDYVGEKPHIEQTKNQVLMFSKALDPKNNPEMRYSLRQGFRHGQDRIADFIKRNMETFGKLPLREQYLDLRRLLRGKIYEIDKTAKALYDVIAKTENPKQILDYFENRDADPNQIADPAERQAAIKAKDLIERIGRRAVSVGLLKPQQFAKYKGQYLPRLYLKHILGEKGENLARNNRRFGDQGYAKFRDESIPEGIRKIILQQIDDPAFLAQKGISVPGRDIAIADFLSHVSLNPEWVDQSNIIMFDTLQEMRSIAKDSDKGLQLIKDWDLEADSRARPVTGDYLKQEGNRLMGEVAPILEESGKTEEARITRDLATRMLQIAKDNAEKQPTTLDPKQWERLPTSPRYGKLSGALVRKEVYEDLTGAFKLESNAESTAEKVLGDAGIMAKAGRFFKVSKTAANLPAGHVRNFVSALINAYMADVPMTRIGPGILDVIRDYKNDGPIKKVAEKYGVLGSSFALNEMAVVESEFVEAMKRTQTKGQFGWMGTAMQFGNIWGRKGLRKVVDMYGLGDDLVKMLVIDDAMNRRGMTASEAVALAEDSIFDYSLVSNNVRWLRNAATGIPFATYLTKSTPFILKTAINKPWKFLPFVILGNAMTEWTKSAFDWDDDDVKAARMSLPEYLREKDTNLMFGNWVPATILPLPYKDANGELQFYDLSYVLPWGQMSQLIAEFGTGEFSKGIKTLGLFGSPMANIITAIQSGKDPFSRRDILPPEATAGETVTGLAKYAYNLMLPPFLHTEFGAIARAMDAASGRVTAEGEPVSTGTQAFGRAIGVNITSIDPRGSRAKNIRRMTRELADITRERNRTRKELVRNKADRADIKEQMDEFMEKIQKKREEIREYRKASIIKEAA